MTINENNTTLNQTTVNNQNNLIEGTRSKDLAVGVTSTTTPTVPEEPRTIRRTFEMEFLKIKEAINISVNDVPLRQQVALYNFGEARLLEGANLVGLVEEQLILRDINNQAKIRSTAVADEKRTIANELFSRFRKIARIAFENDPDAFGALGLHSRLKVAYANWLIQAKSFYDKILGDQNFIDEIAKFNVTKQDLERGKQLVLSAESAATTCVDISATTQTLTSARNLAVKNLLDWWGEYKKVVRIVYNKNREALEKSQIIVLTRTAAPRSSASKNTALAAPKKLAA